MTLRPFWRYYGGKWRAAPRYPAPIHRTIVEPFAGAAGYALRYHDRDVVLVEKYAVIAEIWRWLIAATADEVMEIPCVDSTDDLPKWVPSGALFLVGFCMNSATASPRVTLSAGKRMLRARGGTREGWTEAHRKMVASQVAHIKHWRVIEGDYTAAPDVEATWFVDPPYERAGVHYVHSSRQIDFASLGAWCRSRRGQVIACEANGATWLPFKTFRDIKSFGAGGKRQTSSEAIWTSGDGQQEMRL